MELDPFKRKTDALFKRFGSENGILNGATVDVIISRDVEFWDEFNSVTQRQDIASFNKLKVAPKAGDVLHDADNNRYKLGQVIEDDGYVIKMEIIRASSV